jgi:hypothetical protein
MENKLFNITLSKIFIIEININTWFKRREERYFAKKPEAM